MEVAAYRQPSVLRRKRALAGCVKTEDALLGAGARNVLQQRFQSELDAVRRLVRQATAAVQRSSEEPPAPKRIKASSPPRVDRNQLKAELEKLASELPDHIMQLLMKQSRAIRGGDMEIDMDAVQEEAVLELREKLDEFVRERAEQEHQDDGRTMAEEEEEEEEDVDIVGGVSPLAPIVSAPLHLAEEEDEYVDICGDVSPVALMPKNLGGDTISSRRPSSSSSSDSDSDSDASDSSASDSDSDESVVDSPAPAERAATPP